MAKKALPKIIIKSMWEHINSGASHEDMRDWLVSEGTEENQATELVAKLTACESEEALFELVNTGREAEDPNGSLSEDELEAVAGGARTASAASKFPWQGSKARENKSRQR